MVDLASWKSRESNRSWPLSFEDGLEDDRLLIVECWEERGSSSSPEHGALRLREGVEGFDGGGVGRVCSGTRLYSPSFDLKSYRLSATGDPLP